MNIDFKKLMSNRAVQITALIAVPTVLVGAFLGYKYIKKKRDENKMKKMIDDAKVENGLSPIVPNQEIKVEEVKKDNTDLTNKK